MKAQYLKAAKANVNKHFTAIRIGFELVYAFTDKGGITQFMVYGRLNRKGHVQDGGQLQPDG